MKDDFINVASHEIRTPLTVIRGSIENLHEGLGGELTDKQKGYVQMALRNSDFLAKIVNNMLDLARLESGKAMVKRDLLKPSAVIREPIQAFHQVAADRGLVLEENAPADLPVVETALGRGLRKDPAGYFSIDWSLFEIETDHLTPWLEPYHPPEAPGPGRFLDRARAFYQKVLSEIEGAFLVVDTDGVVTYANAAVSKNLGLDEQHLLGGSLDEIFDEDTAKKLYEIRSNLKLRATPGSFSIYGRYRRKDSDPADSILPVWISGRSLHTPAGEYKACLIGVAVLRV